MEMKRRFPKEREKMRAETDATAPQNALLLVVEGIQSLIWTVIALFGHSFEK